MFYFKDELCIFENFDINCIVYLYMFIVILKWLLFYNKMGNYKMVVLKSNKYVEFIFKFFLLFYIDFILK